MDDLKLQETDIQTALINLRLNVEKGKRNTKESTSTTTKPEGLAEYGLDNFQCDKCGNTGTVWWRDPEDFLKIHTRECDCMKQRRAIRKMKNSGLSDTLASCTFDNFETPTEDYRKIKETAKLFVESGSGFFISGTPGSGKTHICTAICGELLKKGYEVRYFLWRKDAADLKSMINDPEYSKRINYLRNVPVLYIDDFYKGTISEADVNLAFTIINDRYMSASKKTIFSTELSAKKIIGVDEATGSRIVQMCKGFILHSPDLNWRTQA